MPKPLPPHPNVRRCTDIKVSGLQCGSPRGTQKTPASTTSITGSASNRWCAKSRLRPQYLIEYPEFGPPIEPRSAGAPAREAATAQRETQAEPRAAEQNATQKSTTTDPSRGAAKERSPRRKPCDRTRKQSSSEGAKERSRSILGQGRELERKRRIQPAEAAIPGAMAGNWRDLHAVFEFAGISEPNKEALVTREHNR
jgi:hypothetical protein